MVAVGCLLVMGCGSGSTGAEPRLTQPSRPAPSPTAWTASAPATTTVPTTEPTPSATPTATESTTPEQPSTFAIIGDFGSAEAPAGEVADLVASWDPSFIVATGDIYYSYAGGTGTQRYDLSVGAYYCRWLKDISTTGDRCPVGAASVNAFFPAMGNHDVTDAVPGPSTYLEYFTLPGAGLTSSSGNERYYDFVEGPVHFFVLNSNPEEPDGTTVGSTQATWLQTQLQASTAPWKIVVDHHPPYSSDTSHGSTVSMQWPFAAWGADVILSGHAHTYERIERDGIVYFVNGLGGARLYALSPTAVPGSQARFASNWGAQRVTVDRHDLRFEFIDITGSVIDSYALHKD